MPETDLALLTRAASAAGRVAEQYFGKENRSWEKPAGAGPVTEADLAVNAAVEEILRAARPDYGWLSEETDDTRDRLDKARVFVIDPIDGTRSFKAGARTWAHSLAVVENGRATHGVVFLPLRDMLFSAEAGKGATLNDEPLHPSRRVALDGAEVLAARPMMDAQYWRGGPPAFRRSHRPSLAYRMALVAQGRFDAMLTLRPAWEWDIAAGDVLLREAGAVCTDRTGAPLRFNNPHPSVNGVVAANDALHGQTISALGPA